MFYFGPTLPVGMSASGGHDEVPSFASVPPSARPTDSSAPGSAPAGLGPMSPGAMPSMMMPNSLPLEAGASNAMPPGMLGSATPLPPMSSDGKRRRMSPTSAYTSPHSDAATGSPYGFMMQPSPAMSNPMYYSAPPMMQMGHSVSPSPSPRSADVPRMHGYPNGPAMSPLAQRTFRAASTSGASGMMPSPMLPPNSFHESPIMRRANSYGGGASPWASSRDGMSMYPMAPTMTPPQPTAGPMVPPMSAPVVMQCQYNSSQPRAVRDRNRSASTDVWPDDVEVAFWEALRLIPKLGRRKVLVHGKPCGRNELIAEYIERKTGKARSRKQVSSHIQVLKNVKRGDLEFQQLIAEPASEEDYYTPAGGMMYAHALSEYSVGLLGFALTPAEVGASPLHLTSATFSPASASPLLSQSPTQSPAAGMISRALDNLHVTNSPSPAAGRTVPLGSGRVPQPSKMVSLSDMDPSPTVMPTSFSMWVYSSKGDDRHDYTSMDTLAMSRVLQQGAELPMIAANGPISTSFRFPHLAEMQRRLSCPFLHVHVPMTLPRMDPATPSYDRFGVSLSVASTRDTPLTAVLSIYSHGKCVMAVAERLEPPRPTAPARSASMSASSEAEATTPRPPAGPADGRFKYVHRVPFAMDFWADFLSRHHPVHLYSNNALNPAPSFAKQPSERASLGMAAGGLAFVQEFVVAAQTFPPGPQSLPPSAAPNASTASQGARLGEVVAVMAWEFECIESATRTPGVPRVSVLERPPAPQASHEGTELARTSSGGVYPAPATPMVPENLREQPGTPQSPTLGAHKLDESHAGLLGLQLEPVALERPRTPSSGPPRLVHTQPSPAAPPAKHSAREAGLEAQFRSHGLGTLPRRPISQPRGVSAASALAARTAPGGDVFGQKGWVPSPSLPSPGATHQPIPARGLGITGAADLGGPSTMMRSSSTSVLPERSADLLQVLSMPSSPASATGSFSLPSHTDQDEASARLGLPTNSFLSMPSDLMDEFLDSSMMDSSSMLADRSPPSLL